MMAGRRHASPPKSLGRESDAWDLGEPPRGSQVTRAVSPVPSQSASVGQVEMDANAGAERFLSEMHSFMREMQHMTPVMRFEMTQKALLDMQEMVNVHKAMREKTERESREIYKRFQDAEDRSSKLTIENRRKETMLELREEKITDLNQKNKRLTHDLETTTEKLDDMRQKKHALERHLERKTAECERQAEEIVVLKEKNAHLTEELRDETAHRKRLEKQLSEEQNRGVELNRELKATNRELRVQQAQERAAWEATQKTRQSIVDGIDEALSLNPNHFSDFDMLMHTDRSVTVAGSKDFL